MAETTLAAPPRPVTSEPRPDKWLARNEFERSLLEQVRRVEWRTDRPRQAILNWNGIRVIVLLAEQP